MRHNANLANRMCERYERPALTHPFVRGVRMVCS